MVDTTSNSEGNKGMKVSVLKLIFDAYEGETITDEQVQRIVDPVIRMIRAGQFNDPPM